MSDPVRVVVAGAGAVGSVFGGLLAAAGNQVELVGRNPHMAAIGERGLRVAGLFGEAHVRLRVGTDLTAGDQACDLVLVCVKSHATASVAATLAAWQNPPPLVVSLQNGLGNVETLAAALGSERVLGARVIFGALLPEPGAAHVTVNAAPVAIGPLAPNLELAQAAERIAGSVRSSGIPAESVPSVEPLLWEKVLYNCGLNPLGALYGLTYGEVVAAPELRARLNAAIDEGFAVARASGIELRWPDAPSYRAHFYRDLIPPTAAHRSSMRQDLEKGRRTEVDAIGGAIVRAGKRVGLPTPVNQALVDAIHGAEGSASRTA